MELYRKYRPKTLKDVIGQRHAVAEVQALVDEKRIPHAMLFTGPSGTGKTTLARILQGHVNCSAQDFHEVDCGDVKGVENVREIKRAAQVPPLSGGSKVWVVDEAHKMTNDAQNAFLKTLEDAPNHAYFFLCTTDPQKLIKTIRTRCTEINLEPISDEDLEDLVWDVVDQEKIDVSAEVVDEIVLISKGCARKALVLLDQVYSLKTEEEQIKAVRKGVVADEEAEKLSQMLLFPFKSSWSDVAKSLRSIEGSESESVRYMVLGYARACLLGKVGQAPNPKIAPRAFMILEVFADNTFDDKHAGLARMCWEAFNAKV